MRFIDFVNIFPIPVEHWDEISVHPNITMQDILNHPDKPWNWHRISVHPNITMQDILNHPDKPWKWEIISYNKFRLDKTRETYSSRIESVQDMTCPFTSTV